MNNNNNSTTTVETVCNHRECYISKETGWEATHLTCNLSDENTFSAGKYGPPMPVLKAFGASRLNECYVIGSWDYERAIAENPQSLCDLSGKLDKARRQTTGRTFFFSSVNGHFFTDRMKEFSDMPQRLARQNKSLGILLQLHGTKKTPVAGSFQLSGKIDMMKLPARTLISA